MGAELAGSEAQLQQLHKGTNNMQVAPTWPGLMLPAVQGFQAQVYGGGCPPEYEVSEAHSSR